MKKIFFQIIIFLMFFPYCKAQKMNYIDSIQNAKQITDLLSKIDAHHTEFEIKDSSLFVNRRYSHQYYKKIADSLGVQPWTKADFDGNGLSDILVTGRMGYERCTICILDEGAGKYKTKWITVGNFSFSFCVVENNKIKYYSENKAEPMIWSKPPKLQQVVLTYKFGDFIEENQNPNICKIGKIEYETSGCFGTCPVFFLTINADSTSIWQGNKYDEIAKKEVRGVYKTIISKDKFEELIELLHYIDFEKLKNKYAVNWTDDQSATLTITYNNNGKVKTIDDYGLMGTFGLQKVHKLLFDLRQNQKWGNEK